MSLLAAACCCGNQCGTGITGSCCLIYTVSTNLDGSVYVPGLNTNIDLSYLVPQGCTTGIDECECRNRADEMNKEDPDKGVRKFDNAVSKGPVVVRGDWVDNSIDPRYKKKLNCDFLVPADEMIGNSDIPSPYRGCKGWCSCESPTDNDSTCPFIVYGVYRIETGKDWDCCAIQDGDCCCPEGIYSSMQLVDVGFDFSDGNIPNPNSDELNAPGEVGTAGDHPSPFKKITTACRETNCSDGSLSNVREYWKKFDIDDTETRLCLNDPQCGEPCGASGFASKFFRVSHVVMTLGTFPVGKCSYVNILTDILSFTISVPDSEHSNAENDCTIPCQRTIRCTHGEGDQGWKSPCGCCPGYTRVENQDIFVNIPAFGEIGVQGVDRGGVYVRHPYCPEDFNNKLNCNGITFGVTPHTFDY